MDECSANENTGTLRDPQIVSKWLVMRIKHSDSEYRSKITKAGGGMFTAEPLNSGNPSFLYEIFKT